MLGFQSTNSPQNLAKLSSSSAGTRKEVKFTFPQQSRNMIDIFEWGEHFQVVQYDEPEFVEPPEAIYQKKKETVVSGNGRQRVIVNELLRKSHLS